MKIAVLSDIHGNSIALKEVLREAKEEGVEKIFVLGDMVGYYYHPDEVLEMLSHWPCEMIMGNHELLLFDLINHQVDREEVKKKYGHGHMIALDKLSQNDLSFLQSLPRQRSITINSVSFQLNHGSPWSIDEYLYPNTETAKLEACNSNEHDFVLIGHSHYAFVFQCAHSILINCGSVGQSREKGGVAFWSIIDLITRKHQIRQTRYDTNILLIEVEKFDADLKYNREILLRK